MALAEVSRKLSPLSECLLASGAVITTRLQGKFRVCRNMLVMVADWALMGLGIKAQQLAIHGGCSCRV